MLNSFAQNWRKHVYKNKWDEKKAVHFEAKRSAERKTMEEKWTSALFDGKKADED